MNASALLLLTNVCVFAAIYMLARHGYPRGRRGVTDAIGVYDHILNQKLMLNTDPRLAVGSTIGFAAVVGLLAALAGNSPLLGFVVGLLMLATPVLIFKHLQTKRRARLEEQLVDGLVTLASGTRAGLTLVQSMELVVKNGRGPIQQEFGQILREYQMGLDLNRAMRRAADRIGSHLYRLTFTAIEMHRSRGGDTAQSMDRIAESIREIERLEGKLDALTAQGRLQAVFMAVMPPIFLGIYWIIEPTAVEDLLFTGTGRIILLIVAGLILTGFFWIRKILAVDI